MLRIAIYYGKDEFGEYPTTEMQTPFIEEENVEVAPQADVEIGGKPFSTDDVSAKDQEEMFDPHKIDKALNVGFDFDGTLTMNPDFFSWLAKKIRDKGGKCYLVTGRPESEKEKVKAVLSKAELEFDGEHYFPAEYTLEGYFADAKQWDDRIAAWKADVAKKIGLEVMIDDMKSNVDYMEKNVPGITMVVPVAVDAGR